MPRSPPVSLVLIVGVFAGPEDQIGADDLAGGGVGLVDAGHELGPADGPVVGVQALEQPVTDRRVVAVGFVLEVGEEPVGVLQRGETGG